MTGAGKTHTMFGSFKPNSRRQMETGIANLVVKELFNLDGLQSVITVNFLEIYNEQVKDLLCTSQNEG